MTSWAMCGSGQRPHTNLLARTCVSSGGHHGSTPQTALLITGLGSPPGWETLQTQPQTTWASAAPPVQADRRRTCEQPDRDLRSTLSALYLRDHVPEAAGYQAHASEGGLLSPSPLTDTKNTRTARRDCSSLEDEDLDDQGWELGCLLSAVLRTKEPNPPVSKR